MVDLTTNFLDHKVQVPIYNASGCHCVTIQELDELYNSSAGAIVTKSTTVNERKGNPKPRYHDITTGTDPRILGSINSSGLPNLEFKNI